MKNKCPKCGKSHFSIGGTIQTLAYYEPIYKDGVNINPDLNSNTTSFHCYECDTYWEEETNPNRDNFGEQSISNHSNE